MILNKNINDARSEVERWAIRNMITPLQISEALQVPLPTVYAWLSGRREPKDWEEKAELILNELYPVRNDWRQEGIY